MTYSRESPSPRYSELQAIYRQLHDEGDPDRGIPPEHMFPGRSLIAHAKMIGKLIKHFGSRTLLDYGAGKGLQYGAFPPGSEIRDIPSYWGVSVTCYDAGYEPFSTPPTGRVFDAVITTDMLEHCPEEDLSWILDEMFASARHFVYLNVACYPAGKTLPNGENAHVTLHPPAWWHALIQSIASRHGNKPSLLCVGERKPTSKGKDEITLSFMGSIRVSAPG